MAPFRILYHYRTFTHTHTHSHYVCVLIYDFIFLPPFDFHFVLFALFLLLVTEIGKAKKKFNYIDLVSKNAFSIFFKEN